MGTRVRMCSSFPFTYFVCDAVCGFPATEWPATAFFCFPAGEQAEHTAPLRRAPHRFASSCLNTRAALGLFEALFAFIPIIIPASCNIPARPLHCLNYISDSTQIENSLSPKFDRMSSTFFLYA